MDYYKFDAHVHFPNDSERLERMLELAITRKLDGIGFVDYDSTERYDAFTQNKDLEGNKVLDERYFSLQTVNPTQVRVSNTWGSVDIIKAEEINSKNGHILAVGVKEAIQPGYDALRTFEEIMKQKAIGIFAHPFCRLANGCSKDVIQKTMIEFFDKCPICVEQNGQFPENFLANRKAREYYASGLPISLFSNSDIHGNYRNEHEKIGLIIHNVIPKFKLDTDNLALSLVERLNSYHDMFGIRGEFNSFLDTALWNLESLRKNGFSKIQDSFRGRFTKDYDNA